MRNWAGNVTYSTPRVLRPRSVEEAQELIQGAEKIRPLGTRHAFNLVGDSDGALLSTEHLNRIVEIGDTTVTVEAGIRYGELSGMLLEHALAVPNLASLPHISVGGAIATATHGSGVGNQSLAAAVSAIDLVGADGSVRRLLPGRSRLRRCSRRPRSAWACGARVARRRAGVRAASVRLRGASVARRRREPGRDSRGRLQRQPVHVLDRPGHRPGLGEDRGGDRLVFRRDACDAAAQPGSGRALGELHHTAGRSRPFGRPAAALPSRLHPERRRRASVRVRRAAGTRRRGPARASPARPGRLSASAHFGDTHGRCGLAVAQSVLRAGEHRVSLHLEAACRRGARGASTDRSSARAVRRAAALGQAVHRVGGGARRPFTRSSRHSGSSGSVSTAPGRSPTTSSRATGCRQTCPGPARSVPLRPGRARRSSERRRARARSRTARSSP